MKNQNVLPFVFHENENRFTKVNSFQFNDAEQISIIALAIDVLELRHQPGAAFNCPQDTRDYLRLHLSERKNEVFGVLFLDNKHRIICNEEMFTGSISSASVYPRVMVQRTLNCNANAVIFYHNHPSGEVEPSSADIAITKRLKNALELIDVRVLDHYIVGSQGSVAFSERGLL